MDENTIGPATMTTSTHKTKVSRIFHMDEKYAVGVKINPSETILIKKSSKKYPATRALAASKKTDVDLPPSPGRRQNGGY